MPEIEVKDKQQLNRSSFKGKEISWKRVIASVMSEEPFDVWKEKYGDTWAEALVRRGNELFMQGKLSNWFYSIAQYTQPNQQEINVNVTDWRKFEALGISKEAVAQRLQEMKQAYIDGEFRPVTRELEAGRSVDVGGSSEPSQREEVGVESVGSNGETETSEGESSVWTSVRRKQGWGQELSSIATC